MLEKMDDFFTARVNGYDEHMKSNIEGADSFYKYTASLLPKEKNANVTVKKADGTEVETGAIGTGYIVTIDENTYTVIKLGDASGDGQINSADLLKIQKHLLNVNNITDANIISAADVTKDGQINSADLLKIQKHLLSVTKINL